MKYQNWTNYETYLINQLIWDDWRLCRVGSDMAGDGYCASKIAVKLEEQVKDLYPDTALNEINWLEIAENFLAIKSLLIGGG